MQNEKISSIKGSKTLSKNIQSGTIPEETNKDQVLEQSLRPDSKKRNRGSSPKRRKRKKQKPVASIIHRYFKSDLLFQNEKVKTKFLYCFNIKELIILMEVNSTFYENIVQLEYFKKYIKLRSEFLLKENIYQKILVSNNEETINYALKNKKYINIPENKLKQGEDNKNNINLKISQSRVYHEKFNSKGIKKPVKLGLNNVLTIYPTLAGEKEKHEKDQEVKNNNNNINNKFLEVLMNKEKDKMISIKEIQKSLFPPLDFKKLDINSLLKNNAEKIKKLSKKYNLSPLENRIIFNGIIEHLIFMNDLNEGNDQHPIVITNLKASNGFNYYIESLLNIDFDEIIKINFNNILFNSMQIMKTLCFIFHKYSYCLRILILSNNNIDDKFSKLLFPSLQENKILYLLDLSNNSITNEGLAFGELLFIDNRSMDIVIFDNNLLGPIGIYNLCSFLRNNQKTSINMLDLGYNGITKEGINHLINYLKNNKNKITKLYLGGNYLCDEGVEILSTIFKRIDKVKQDEPNENNDENNNDESKNNINDSKNVNIENKSSFNKISVNNIRNSLKNRRESLLSNIFNNFNNNYIENNNIVSFLDLQNNNLTKKSSHYLSTIISSNNPDLKELILYKNNLGNEGIYKIISSLKINNSLLSLDISDTKIDEKAIKYISDNIDDECVLEKLLLSKNNLKKACEYIKNLLLKKTNIRYIKLTACKIEDNFNLIFQGLEGNKNLQILDMSNNNLSLKQELFEDIINPLKSNNTLIKLKFNETNIDDTAVDYISKGLELNEGLRKIYLKKNYLGKNSVKMLSKAIENNKNCVITKIELEGNDEINNKLIQQIIRAIENNKDNLSECYSEMNISDLDCNKKYNDEPNDIFS